MFTISFLGMGLSRQGSMCVKKEAVSWRSNRAAGRMVRTDNMVWGGGGVIGRSTGSSTVSHKPAPSSGVRNKREQGIMVSMVTVTM